MPQMSPIYWLYISMYIYIHFMLMLILINSINMNTIMFKSTTYKKMWKWYW